MNTEVLVVGAGLSGSVTARQLAERGLQVTVIEKNPYVAGNCYDYRNSEGIDIHLHGPHIFHTVDETVWNYVNRFAVFNDFQHKVMSYVNDMFVPFPINKATVKMLYNETDLRTFLKKEIASATFNTPPENFRDVIVSQVGEDLYNKFYKNYTMKQWQTNPENLSKELAFRIPIRYDDEDRYFTDPYQGIPIEGYTRLVENILSHDNITLILDTDYFAIKNDLDVALTVYTGKLDQFFDYEFGVLKYRSLVLDFQTLPVEQLQPVAVVNYPNNHKYTRVTEFKHFLDQDVAKTTVLYEYSSPEGVPYYVVPDKENFVKKDHYMNKVKLLEGQGTHLFIGRLAEYKYYNMDQAIKAALVKAENYLVTRFPVKARTV